MSKTLAVFGATGKQGGSIIRTVLSDPELSQAFQIRAVTRDVESPKARQLAEKVAVVAGDASDRASLDSALAGAHTVFAMTLPTFGSDGYDVEVASVKNIADAAVAAGAAYLIFSTLPGARAISGGKYTKVAMFDAKAEAEEYIRTLPIKSAFFSPGSFMENFGGQPIMRPKREEDGTYVFVRNVAPECRIPLICTSDDTGKFIGAILASPDKYVGKTFYAGTRMYSMTEIAETLSKATKKTVKYKQLPNDEFKSMMPFGAEMFSEGFRYMEDFGYWGPKSEESLAWAVENARGKLTTFEEFLDIHPLNLE